MPFNQDEIAEVRQQTWATLEELIDKTALEFVVTTLAKICHETAAQLRLGSKESAFAAKEWSYNAVILDRAAVAIASGEGEWSPLTTRTTGELPSWKKRIFTAIVPPSRLRRRSPEGLTDIQTV